MLGELPAYNRDLTGPLPGVVLHRAVRGGGAAGGGGKVALAHGGCAPRTGWVLHTPKATYNRSRDGHFWNHCAVCELPLVRVD